MVSTRRFILRAPSALWMIDHPEVGRAARSDAAEGVVFADLVLNDPTKLEDLYRAAVVHSLRWDAPAGVAEELLRCSRDLAVRAERWKASEDSAKLQLGTLRGLRDRDEIGAALRHLLNRAPDERTRSTLERLARYVSQELTTLKPDGAEHIVVTITNPIDPDEGEPPRPRPATGRPGPDMTGEHKPTPSRSEMVIPEPAEGPLVELFAQIADLGRAGAADFAVQHGLDVDQARALGGFYATQTVLGFQTAPTSETSGSGFGSKLWGTVFAALGGALIAGPAGAVGGFIFGSAFSTTHTAQQVTTLIHDGMTAIHAHVHPAFSGTFTQVMNCLLCDHCESCQVADQVMQTAHPQ